MIDSLKLATMIALVVATNGCNMAETMNSTNTANEVSLRNFVDAEFTAWMADQESMVQTFDSKIGLKAPPIRYDIRSIVDSSPDPRVFPVEKKWPDGWESWTFYRVNVVVEWKSQAGTPLETVVTYNATWSPTEKRWYIGEDTH